MGKFFSWIGDLLKSCFDGIIGFFISIWDFFWNILVGIGNFFLDCWNYLWNWFQWAFYSAVDWVLSQFVGVLDILCGFIHFEFNKNGATAVIDFIKNCNSFFPLDVLFFCAGSYLTCLVCWCIYKFIKSWIPTVSGT